MRNLLFLFVVLGLATNPASATTALQGVPPSIWQDNADGNLLHPLSGTVFPAKTDSYFRGDTYNFRDDGSDVSVTYGLQSNDGYGEITLYVTRANNELPQYFDSASSSIVERFKGVKLVHEGVLAAEGKEFPSGPLRVYGIRAKGKLYHTGVWVARKGDWLLKVRFTYDAKLAQMIEDLQGSLNKELAKESGPQASLSTSVNDDGSLADMKGVMEVLRAVNW